MTNPTNQPWKPATAPRVSGANSNEVVKNKPLQAAKDVHVAPADNQGIPNAALNTQSPGSTSASPVGSSSPGVGTPTAVPGGAVPSTPGV